MPSGGSPGRMRHALLAGYALLCLAALVWPGYDLLANRVQPHVLGLPLSFAWNVGWVVLTFVVLAVYHFVTREEG